MQNNKYPDILTFKESAASYCLPLHILQPKFVRLNMLPLPPAQDNFT